MIVKLTTMNNNREVKSKRVPSKYLPIWEKIKRTKNCTIEVEPKLAPRVKKAVIKEKHKDLGFKVLNDNDYLFLNISYDPAKKRMKFVLKQRIGLEEVRR